MPSGGKPRLQLRKHLLLFSGGFDKLLPGENVDGAADGAADQLPEHETFDQAEAAPHAFIRRYRSLGRCYTAPLRSGEVVVRRRERAITLFG